MVTIHWSIGGSAPPENACTGPQPAQAFLELDADERLIHFAVESDVSGYVSMGFPQRPELMYDADIILGWVGPDGRGFIDTYFVTSWAMTQADAVPNWSIGAGVVEQTRPTGQPRTILCFSRKQVDSRLRVAPVMEPTSDPVIRYSWATHFADSLDEHPVNWYGGGFLDVVSGSASEVTITNRNGDMVTHGVLMTIAWALLLPLGLLAPAHRWALPGKVIGGKPIWFWSHMLLQLCGLAIFAAGFILAMVKFSRPLKGTLYFAHAVMGYLICGLAGLQLIGAFIRPDPGTKPRRLLWNPLHIYGGRAVVFLSWAACFTGAVVHHRSVYKAPLAAWVAPLAAVMGTIFVADLVLRVLKPKPADPALPAVKSVDPAPSAVAVVVDRDAKAVDSSPSGSQVSALGVSDIAVNVTKS